MYFDSPTHETALISPAVLRAAEIRNSLQQPHLGYIVKPPDKYPDGEMQIRRAVYEQEHWAAISVTRNATGKLEDALRSGDRSFDQDSLADIIFVEARQIQRPTTVLEYIIRLRYSSSYSMNYLSMMPVV